MIEVVHPGEVSQETFDIANKIFETLLLKHKLPVGIISRIELRADWNTITTCWDC